MRRAFSVLFLLSLIRGAGRAQSVPADESISSSGVKLTVTTRGGQSVFHVGEVIPLQLSFASGAPKTYQLDMATGVRSEQFAIDTFTVQPDKGWDNPLSLYFRSVGGFIGGGVRGSQVLSDQATVIDEELNEWVRFRQPGKYRLTVTSRRVSRCATPHTYGSPEVTSNELSLTIVPATQNWQQEALRSALSLLDRETGKKTPPGAPGPRRDAIKTLRYLGTAEAAREMARQLDDPVCAADCFFGLVASVARDAAFEELNRLLRDPDRGVSPDLLTALSVLALPENASGGVPRQREQAEAGFRQELLSMLSTKHDAALAVSANTIVEDASTSSKELPADLKQFLTAQLISTFDHLPASKQSELLEMRWKTLDHQNMLPFLKQVAQRYQDFSDLREVTAFDFNHTSLAALRHWFEMDPDGARLAILCEISRARPRFDAQMLGMMLPDHELPEIEQALAEHLNQLSIDDLDAVRNLASLILRYAGGAVEGPIAGYLDEHRREIPCQIQADLLAYLLKVDPAGGRSRLVQAMDAGGAESSACRQLLPMAVGNLRNDPTIEFPGTVFSLGR